MKKLKRLYALLRSDVENERETDLLQVGFYVGIVAMLVIIVVIYIVDKLIS